MEGMDEVSGLELAMKRQHFKLVKNYGLRLKFPASVLYWQYGINETNIENNYQFEHYQIFDKSNVLEHFEFVRTIRTLDKMFRKKILVDSYSEVSLVGARSLSIVARQRFTKLGRYISLSHRNRYRYRYMYLQIQIINFINIEQLI